MIYAAKAGDTYSILRKCGKWANVANDGKKGYQCFQLDQICTFDSLVHPGGFWLSDLVDWDVGWSQWWSWWWVTAGDHDDYNDLTNDHDVT